MIGNSEFLAASKAAVGWLNTIHFIAKFGEAGNVRFAYELLMPRQGGDEREYTLQSSYHKHLDVLTAAMDKLTALDLRPSDGPITFPCRCSNAHAAAMSLAATALDLLVLPLVLLSEMDQLNKKTTDPKKQRQKAKELLARHWQKLVIPQCEWEKLRERIGWERAKFLAGTPAQAKPDDALSDPWEDFRDGPGGPWMTVEHCKARYSVSGPTLSGLAKKNPSIRRKNPSGGSGYVYLHRVVTRINNQRSDDD